jgi:phosphoserine phosphatase
LKKSLRFWEGVVYDFANEPGTREVALKSIWTKLGLLLLPFTLLAGCPKTGNTEKTKLPENPALSTQALTSEALPGSWENDVRENLLKFIAEQGRGGKNYDPKLPPLVVLDFDNTCIRGDIGRSFFDWMIAERKIRFSEELLAALPEELRPAIKTAWEKLSNLPSEKQAASDELQALRKLMHQAYWSLCRQEASDKCFPWQVRFYAGYTPAELSDMAFRLVGEEIKKPLGSEIIKAGPEDTSPGVTGTGIRIFEEVRTLTVQLEKHGFDVWIVSAGPQWVVEGAAKYFGFDPKRVLGMRAKVTGGKLTSEIEMPPTFREGKVKAIEKFIGRKPVLALGDSWTDFEMLSYAAHALLFDRGYLDLKQKAQDAGWWIQPAFPTN